jgi:hypothetical protein
MKRPVTRTACALFLLALAAVACSHDIGDSCMTSVDCDPNGTRSCDLSQPGGYCTILGCDPVTAICPGGSACIRFFPLSLLPGYDMLAANGMACDPTVTPTNCPTGLSCSPAGACTPITCDPAVIPTTCPGGLICSSDGHCAKCDSKCEDVSCASGQIEDQCLADEICLDAGICAKAMLEQRMCAKSCSSTGDCRSGYECRPTGLAGSMVLASDPNMQTAFCAPHVP